MTLEKQDILSDFYSGNSKDIRVTCTNVDGTAKDLTNSEVTYALFDDNGNILIVKSSLDTDEIELTDPTDGECLIHLLPPDSLHLHGSYRHHVNVIDSLGYEETILTGRVSIFKSFARRPRKTTMPAYLNGG